MDHHYKGKAKYILAWASVLLFVSITLYGGVSRFRSIDFHSYLTSDTIPRTTKASTGIPPAFDPSSSAPANVIQPAIRSKVTDTTWKPASDTIFVKSSKDSLDAPIVYHADDSMILDVPTKKIILYGKKASVTYKDNELTAPEISFDQRTNIVSAHMVRDSLGNVVAFATFNQADFKSVNDSVSFNMKTLKGRTVSTYFTQEDLYVHVDKSKKLTERGDIVIYGLKARFTTCNLDTPHFAFISNKIKFINKKVAFSGPVHPEFEGVPIPIYFPFGIYPLSKGRHSGILAPTFSANDQLGLSLDGLGYYKVLGDNWDLVTRGTLYSYGGWTASISPRYYKRYHYQGNLSLDIQHFRDLDNAGGRNFNIRWSHSSDTKARPGVNFSANVNAGSSKFNSSVPNSQYRNYQNQLNSSITYSKVWKDKPYNLTVSANHNQNTTQRLINLNLPDIGFNVNTLYPFRRSEPIGAYKWYENIGVALNTNAKSLSSFYDTAGHIFNQLSKNLQWGANHNVPISLSLPEIGHMQIAPSITYQERWFQEKFIRTWNAADKKVDTAIKKGFYSAREMTFGLGVGTRIFGMYTFKNKNKTQIRHEVRPSLSVNYKPDMNGKYWYNSQVDTFGNIGRFSVFDNSIFGPFSEGKFGGLTFGIDNNIQMKVKRKHKAMDGDTTASDMKKITLLDGLSINGAYNFMADSFKLSTFNVSARTNLFDKVSITANGIIDPYLTNGIGNRIDKYAWSKKFSLGRLTSGSISAQSQLQGGKKGTTMAKANQQMQAQQQLNTVAGMPLNEYQQEAAYISNNPGEFADFNIPWSVNFSYSLSYAKIIKADYSGYNNTFSQNVTIGGTLNLTEKWQIGVNGYYNITEHTLNSLSMYLTREMHCWQMAINIAPVGRYRSFNITINPKSSILRDLKVNRTRYFYDL